MMTTTLVAQYTFLGEIWEKLRKAVHVLCSAGTLFQWVMGVNEKADCVKAFSLSGTFESEFRAD